MKTKALISTAVAAQLICTFGFAYADCWFSDTVTKLKQFHVHNSSYTVIPMFRRNPICTFVGYLYKLPLSICNKVHAALIVCTDKPASVSCIVCFHSFYGPFKIISAHIDETGHSVAWVGQP